MKKNFLVFSFFLTIIISCAPRVSYASFDAIPRSAHNNEIAVFTTPQSIPYKFKEIGLINIQFQENRSTDAETISIAKNKAREVGGDGILLVSDNKINDGYYNTESYSMPYTKNIVKFSVITKIVE